MKPEPEDKTKKTESTFVLLYMIEVVYRTETNAVNLQHLL